MALILEIAAGVVLGGLILLAVLAFWREAIAVAILGGIAALVIVGCVFAWATVYSRDPTIVWFLGGAFLILLVGGAVYGLVAGFMGWEIE